MPVEETSSAMEKSGKDCYLYSSIRRTSRNRHPQAWLNGYCKELPGYVAGEGEVCIIKQSWSGLSYFINLISGLVSGALSEVEKLLLLRDSLDSCHKIFRLLSQDIYPLDLLFLEAKVTVGEKDSEKRRQTQNEGRDAKFVSCFQLTIRHLQTQVSSGVGAFRKSSL